MEQEQEEVQEELDLDGGRVIWNDSGVCLSLLRPQQRNKGDTLPVKLVFLMLMLVLMLVLMLAKEEARLWLLGKVTTG